MINYFNVFFTTYAPIPLCSNNLFKLLYFLQYNMHFGQKFVLFFIINDAFLWFFVGRDLRRRVVFNVPWSGRGTVRPQSVAQTKLLRNFWRISEQKIESKLSILVLSIHLKETSFLSLRLFRGGAAGYCLRVRIATWI